MDKLKGWLLILLFAMLLSFGARGATPECGQTDDRKKKLCQFTHILFRGDLDGKANVSQDWKAADSRYVEGVHAGIDFATSRHANKPFYTVAGGQVVYRNDGGGPGWGPNSVVTSYVTNTQTGRPELHKYGHGSNLLVHPGQYVHAGQQLGITDQIGASVTGIHVHYEVSEAKYYYANQWYDLTANDAINYLSVQPLGKRAAIEQILRLTVASKTLDPVASVFTLRAQGRNMWVRGIPDYTEVTQGQTAVFTFQTYGGNINIPFRFEAWNLPNGFSPEGSGWSPQAVSASDHYPAASTLTIKTSAATAAGTQRITLKAIALDGQERSYDVVLNVKPSSTGGSQPVDPKAQALADVRHTIRQVSEITQIFEQHYYEDLGSSSPYELRWWYAQVNSGNWTIIYHASNKNNRNERYWAYYDGNWNWRGWYQVQ